MLIWFIAEPSVIFKIVGSFLGGCPLQVRARSDVFLPKNDFFPEHTSSAHVLACFTFGCCCWSVASGGLMHLDLSKIIFRRQRVSFIKIFVV